MELQLLSLGSGKLRHLWHKSAVLWGVTPSGLVQMYRVLEGTCALFRQSKAGRSQFTCTTSHLSNAAKSFRSRCCERPDLRCLSSLV